MAFPRREDNGLCSRIVLILAVGFGFTVATPEPGSAKPKNPIYNVCACACSDPTTGFGELLPDIQNTAGLSCDAYNNRPCSLDGGTRTGKTKFCGGYKPGGTRAMLSTIPNAKFSIIGRGVEGETTAQESESAALTSESGNVMMNCSCDGGKGSCSVTSTDGKTSTCHKGNGDTCTGTCAYPTGTISGE